MNNLTSIFAGKAYGVKNREESNERRVPMENVGAKSQAVTGKILSGSSGFLQSKADGMKNKIGGTHPMLNASHPMLGGYKNKTQNMSNKIMGGHSGFLQAKTEGMRNKISGSKTNSQAIENKILGGVKTTSIEMTNRVMGRSLPMMGSYNNASFSASNHVNQMIGGHGSVSESRVNRSLGRVPYQGGYLVATNRGYGDDRLRAILGNNKAQGMTEKILGANNSQGKVNMMLGNRGNSQNMTGKILGTNSSQGKVNMMLGSNRAQGMTGKILGGNAAAQRVMLNVQSKKPTSTKVSGSIENQVFGKIKSPTSYPQKLSSITFKTEKLGINNMNANKGLPPFGDKDKDGVMNIYDCEPKNRKKQGFIHKAVNWAKGKSYRENTPEEDAQIDVERYRREDEAAGKAKEQAEKGQSFISRANELAKKRVQEFNEERDAIIKAEREAKLASIKNRPEIEKARALATAPGYQGQGTTLKEKDMLALFKSKTFVKGVKDGSITPEMISAYTSHNRGGYAPRQFPSYMQQQMPNDLRAYTDRTSARARVMSMEEAAATPEVRGRVQSLTGGRDDYTQGISTMSRLGGGGGGAYSHGLTLMSKTGTTNIPYAIKVAEYTGNKELVAQLQQLQAQQQQQAYLPETGPLTEFGPVQQPVQQVVQSVPQATDSQGLQYSPLSKRLVRYPRGHYNKVQRIVTIQQ